MLYEREAQLKDVFTLASNIREADRLECLAASGEDPLTALRKARETSTVFRALVMGPPKGNHDVVALYGVVPFDRSVGLGGAWLLGTDQLVEDGFRFARRCSEYIEKLHQQFPILFNFVDERNALHIRWLRWAGFSFINRHEHFGAEQRPFYEFVRMQR